MRRDDWFDYIRISRIILESETKDLLAKLAEANSKNNLDEFARDTEFECFSNFAALNTLAGNFSNLACFGR